MCVSMTSVCMDMDLTSVRPIISGCGLTTNPLGGTARSPLVKVRREVRVFLGGAMI